MTNHNIKSKAKGTESSKIVNIDGINLRAKACKHCGTMITSMNNNDTGDHRIIEVDNGNIKHTAQRCTDAIKSHIEDENAAIHSQFNRPTTWRRTD